MYNKDQYATTLRFFVCAANGKQVALYLFYYQAGAELGYICISVGTHYSDVAENALSCLKCFTVQLFRIWVSLWGT